MSIVNDVVVVVVGAAVVAGAAVVVAAVDAVGWHQRYNGPQDAHLVPC